ncbi:MAG TPA: hypothetical protein PLJ34_09450 [Hyphomicrobiales bacterium]|nr:hypothetical protein [Kaistiaceae bacterium]HQF31657.1 hypothetical protein [Hyphomicrobiales bacterium]
MTINSVASPMMPTSAMMRTSAATAPPATPDVTTAAAGQREGHATGLEFSREALEAAKKPEPVKNPMAGDSGETLPMEAKLAVAGSTASAAPTGRPTEGLGTLVDMRV